MDGMKGEQGIKNERREGRKDGWMDGIKDGRKKGIKKEGLGDHGWKQ